MNAPVSALSIRPDMAQRLYKPNCGMAQHCFAAFLGDLRQTAEVAGVKSRRIEARARQEIFAEGDEAGEIYEIAEGAVMLYRLLADGRRQVVELLVKGDVFGVPYGAEYDCSAETLRPSVLNAFERRAAEQDPALQRMMAHATRRQLEAAHDHVLTIGRKTATERVASFLVRIFRHAGNTPELVLPMTRQEIADFLGLTIETVSRIISSFKRQGLIRDLRGEKLTIADVEALEDLANAW